ncbi:MAG TPA: M23 family metallopeptidase [Thermoanaerobaculia bacterium]|nr:M23 family metallopeptidase [Thermoanaerobaculia bacterium]
MIALAGGGCASVAPQPQPTTADTEIDRLVADLEHDLARIRAREPRSYGARESAPGGGSRFEGSILSKETLLSSLILPVANLHPRTLSDSWGAPRDGGRRRHRGIDIFAPRGTPIVAVADGVVTYIGNQPKGGRCLWLATETGLSFYYAHLDRWAPGLYEGMSVRQGVTLGFVGNTGNALTTPPHLHFSVVDGDDSVNPYPILRRASRASARPLLSGGLAAGGS